MRKYILLMLVFILLLASYGAGFSTHYYLETTKSSVPEFRVFWEAWDILKEHFYGSLPDNRQMTHAAIRGVVSELGDPYTTFLEPQTRSLEKDELKGEFGGIGAWLEKTKDGRFVLTPLDGYPAQKAGIQAGDELIKVNGTPIKPEMTINEVLLLVRGPIGSYVTLVVRRGGEELTFKVKRERIETPSVEWKVVKPGIGYVKITTFTERTSREMKQAMRELKASGVSALILDLRGNPGGIVEAALEAGGFFIEKGVMFYERYKDGSEKAFKVKPSSERVTWPLVVLVDKNTASAAEILAGALQELKHAPLIGERTYGKGSVQFIYDLSDGSSLHVTAARWFTPNHREIEGNGLEPDIKVEPKEGVDVWMEEAIALLAK
ncbi:MAG TPA: S41 family peptidase [Chloroflexi bacterium]|nr:S41 family peptidase [Chloroflexota bacterium]